VERLKKAGRKGETYDDIVKRLLDRAPLQAGGEDEHIRDEEGGKFIFHH